MDYSELVAVYQELEKTSKRLEKTFIISNFLKKVPAKDLQASIYLLQGTVFPPWSMEKIGVSDMIVIKALSSSTGESPDKIKKLWKEHGDLGLVAEKIANKKRQATLFKKSLEIREVFDAIRSLTKVEGHGSIDQKLKIMNQLLGCSSPEEVCYLVRTFLGDLRVGVGEGVLGDSIVWAYLYDRKEVFSKKETIKKDIDNKDNNRKDTDKKCTSNKDTDKKDSVNKDSDRKENEKIDKNFKLSPEEQLKYNEIALITEEAFNTLNDYAKVAELAKKGLENLKDIPLMPGTPLKLMLFVKADSIPDAFERVGSPAAWEYKYDGFRVQIHKQKEDITLFTRRLEDVTPQFPDVVEAIRKGVNGDSFIIDAEVVGFDKKTFEYLPFQSISQRIRRKYDIPDMVKNFPVETNVFDVIFHNGDSVAKKSFTDRRKLLEAIVKPIPRLLVIAKQIITDDEKIGENFYSESLKKGFEGVMVKRLDAPYKPGRREGYGVKLKPVMEALDLVIVRAEWGEGKRTGWFTTFTLACQDEEGNLLEIGNVGTGIKEKEGEDTSFEELTNLLKPLVISQVGKSVIFKPKVVVEIHYEEIQKSPTYSSGYALRFPRFIRLRDDKPLSEISTINQVEGLYENKG